MEDPSKFILSDPQMSILPENAVEYDNVGDALVNTGIGSLELTAIILDAPPTIHAHATPLVVRVATSIWPPNLEKASAAIARAGRVVGDVLTYQSTAATGKNNFFIRRKTDIIKPTPQDTTFRNSTSKLQHRKSVWPWRANDISVQQTQIDNARALKAFLRTKYTNTELYA
ncbi:MAG: hypothetical protein Q9205_005237 [Flavoplaca limonia]